MLHPFVAANPLPERFPNPFGEPHPLAWQAARALQDRLPALDEGKMFGVLIVRRPDGALGVLHAFSGKHDGWTMPGFVGPVFNPAALDAFWPAGQVALAQEGEAIAAATAKLRQAEQRHAAVDAEWQARRAAMKARHATNKAARRARRAAEGPSRALDQESRADTGDWRRARAAHATELAPLSAEVARLRAERAALVDARTAHSQRLMHAIHALYTFQSVAGTVRSLHDLHAPHTPPAGAGECAGPKLLAYAITRRLHPIALAEFWWGPPPPGGGRWHGQAYPACRGKCGVIMPFQLEGLDVAPPPRFEALNPDAPTVLYEDDWLLAVDKPSGLLSVPGRNAQPTVISRLERDDVRPVHRLDLDTSGVLVLAKTEATCIAMQKRFARRTVEKRYVAVLDGRVPGAGGQIDLALRRDIHDRPRQMHDPTGRPALTWWARLADNRVALFPTTGRTHQLRVHCAHAKGLGVPIVGDRLYGRPAERLMLHAERIGFEHPVDDRWIVIECPAPF